MPRWAIVTISAVINGLIAFGTAMSALLFDLKEGEVMADVSEVSIYVAFIGAGLVALKDIQAYLAKAGKQQAPLARPETPL